MVGRYDHRLMTSGTRSKLYRSPSLRTIAPGKRSTHGPVPRDRAHARFIFFKDRGRWNVSPRVKPPRLERKRATLVRFEPSEHVFAEVAELGVHPSHARRDLSEFGKGILLSKEVGSALALAGQAQRQAR